MSATINQAIRLAYQTGKVILGSKKTLDLITTGKVNLVLLAANSPEDIKELIEKNTRLMGIPVYIYQGSSKDLGSACGKPFMINALAIQKPGDSNILTLAEGKRDDKH